MRSDPIRCGLEALTTKHPPRVTPLHLQVRIAALRPCCIGLRLGMHGKALGDQQQRQALVGVLAAQAAPLTLADSDRSHERTSNFHNNIAMLAAKSTSKRIGPQGPTHCCNASSVNSNRRERRPSPDAT